VIIGNTRYMLSVMINLEGTGLRSQLIAVSTGLLAAIQYWQFANRHNPYIDVGYNGADQKARISRASGGHGQDRSAERGCAKSRLQMYPTPTPM